MIVRYRWKIDGLAIGRARSRRPVRSEPLSPPDRVGAAAGPPLGGRFEVGPLAGTWPD
jgi:hypothetical protein